MKKHSKKNTKFPYRGKAIYNKVFFREIATKEYIRDVGESNKKDKDIEGNAEGNIKGNVEVSILLDSDRVEEALRTNKKIDKRKLEDPDLNPDLSKYSDSINVVLLLLKKKKRNNAEYIDLSL